jgi:hypothetical protein
MTTAIDMTTIDSTVIDYNTTMPTIGKKSEGMRAYVGRVAGGIMDGLYAAAERFAANNAKDYGAQSIMDGDGILR